MSRDYATAVQPLPLPVSERIISATPYVWRVPSSIPPRQWVYGRQLLRGTVSVVVAPGATGKTALLTGTALALVTGRPVLGDEIWDGPKRVWVWNLEDSGEELARGIQAAAMHWGIGAADIGDRLFVDSGLDGAELSIASTTRDGLVIHEPVIEALVTELIRRRIDVLVVDPFVSSHSVSENDNGAIDTVAKLWAKVAVRANCAIILVHHARKMAGAEVSSESARGAVSLTQAARSCIVLNRMSVEEAKDFGVEGDERRRFFRTYDDKNNRAPPAITSTWYRLASVSLGNAPGGGDNMPVVVPWSPPDVFERISVDDLEAVQARVASREWRSSDQSPEWVGHALAEVLQLDPNKPTDRRRIKTALSTWIRNGALKVEHRRDGSRQTRPFVVVGEPVVRDE
ncbi:uncharacterized protein YjiS (DUF1127 family) [Sphingomonas sp. BE138]|uniref:AAA family ATPase n=1 Tax=Sphingomonas sp. BE138 TaxID=2817845 RepID=UPI00285C0376|nr:AAA family ATPase [Sphingomonas sp. BE138]MDR6790797.1 uncharacterized protein YjiS (DUF1127 family) [Sphingomonas sp. BE138]